MKDEADTPPKSQEYQNFENGLKRILSVSKKDLDAKIAEEKQAKQTTSVPDES